ncbi:MAG: 30S ribosomal protein S6 [bacterium]
MQEESAEKEINEEIKQEIQGDSIVDVGGAGNVYEIGYLLVPTTAEEQVPALYGNMKEAVTSMEGTLISDEMPKMIPLAYTMLKVYKNVRSKYDTAYFGWVKFTMDSQKLLELKKTLDLDPNIIRFLIVKTVKENTIAARRFMHREGGGTSHRRPVTAKREGEAPVEINKEEVDKEIEAMVSAA